MSTKNTILKKYDGRFKDIFQEIYEAWVIFFVYLSTLADHHAVNTEPSSKRLARTTSTG